MPGRQDRLLPEFAMAWFNSDAGRNHFFKSGKTTSGLGTIISQVIRTAPIPLPDIETQRDWVAKLAGTQAEAQAKRTQAATLRQSAWATFEAALFTATEEPRP